MGYQGVENWINKGDRDFDTYDVTAFFYGWIMAMQDGFKGDTASNCFYASFSFVQ